MNSDIIDLMRQMKVLSSEEKGSVYEAAKMRAWAETEVDFEKQMLPHIRAVICEEHIRSGEPFNRADIYSKADHRILDQLKIIKDASLDAQLKIARHQQKLNLLRSCESLLIAEQSLAKHLS